ncbi:MAG: ribonuclease E/G [Rhodospirillaceae bacterium]
MVKRMLVDANHPEETRVVVLNGTRLEEFDLETSTKKQNKGNIYLAKVIRVEPSLQAAFVDYGGNRHGFLAFSEIHPDYYQIPVADREALLAEAKAHDQDFQDVDDSTTESQSIDSASNDQHDSNSHKEDQTNHSASAISDNTSVQTADEPAILTPDQAPLDNNTIGPLDENISAPNIEPPNGARPTSNKANVEEVGGDDETDENLNIHRRRFVASRRYKIQEVIKRRQILLIQVAKEERGNKGAALTTYLSLAGRYCVLMPNSSRGGGVSRKITNLKDRRRLKSIVSDLNISDHMAIILRTAGAERSRAEVKRDFEYLQRTWNKIREVTMESRAPALIHEEGNLIKRSIRDVYSRDIEEIYVEGEDGYKSAKDFMKTLTPSHAKKVKRYKDEIIPLFHRYQVESQLDAMHSPTVQLKSGGSIVLGQTEALVAIDVNSGRATKERHIEETALKTNLEAAEEIARQLRLRDLAGLVVIDFIDMDENRNNHAVERRLKEALKIDRARIQVGRISHFGLLELSRQRLRPSVIEANFELCKSCNGSGMIRSIESTSIQTLRAIEEEGLRQRTAELKVTVNTDVALYVLNSKRIELEEIQKRYDMNVFILGDPSLIPPELRMEKVKGEVGRRNAETKPSLEEEHTSSEDEEHEDSEKKDIDPDSGRKRRRRRRRRRKPDGEQSLSNSTPDGEEKTSTESKVESSKSVIPDAEETSIRDLNAEPHKKSRRRGRRGGRKRNREGQGDPPASDSDQSRNIAVQPSATSDLGTPPSNLFNVVRKGIDALWTSSSNRTLEKSYGNASKSPQTLDQNNQRSSDNKNIANEQSATEKPTTAPKQGWWNKIDT